MKTTTSPRFRLRLPGGRFLAALIVAAVIPSAALAASASLAANPGNDKSQRIPLDQLGAVAGKQYQGDGLTVSATPEGARLRCVFQRLEGEATREGLWLTSTVPNAANDRFRVVAADVRRLTLTRNLKPEGRNEVQSLLTSAATNQGALPRTGDVSVEGRVVRFTRPGLVEEYRVSLDGVRQDFIIEQPPLNPQLSTADPCAGDLVVRLAVSGASVEPTVLGAQLVLENSGRRIAYSRLRVTDATGKELPARLEVVDEGESQRDSILQPKVARLRATLGQPAPATTTLKGLRHDPEAGQPEGDATPLGLKSDSRRGPRVARPARNPGLADAIPSGLIATTGDSPTEGRAPMLAVFVKDADAVYPVRIDPTFSDANWMSMNPSILGASDAVSAAVVDGSGNLYIGGLFAAANNIAKWNGSSWSALGAGVNGRVYALAVSGSDLYAGGGFWTAGGVAANFIAKWNGSSWSALGSGMNDYVRALAVSGSDVYAGGRFTTAGGVAANRIAKWNGSTWSALGSGMNSTVSALAVSGSDLYAGGSFTTAGGVAVNRIAKWNGSSWSALGSGMGGGFNGAPVYALAVSGSDLYAGGDFTTAGGSAATGIAKWNGSSWSALGSGMGGDYAQVYALAVSGSGLYAGGYFTTAGGVAANSIAKWNGSSWSALGSGINNTVHALAVSGSNVYAGGFFTNAGGVTANHIAKWNGGSWSALGSGMDYFVGVYALAVAGSDVYAGGYFTPAVGVEANYVAKWNGSSWSALGSGMDGPVSELAVSGSDLYAGGYFTTAGGSAASSIAKWNGSSWSALGSGMDGTDSPFVSALAVSGSNVYAGGWFTTAGGVAATNIAKWNGSSWSVLGSGMNSGVTALAVSGSDLYAGGYFTTAGGVAANGIAKWNGSSWSALGSGMDRIVYALAVSGSDLYAGGIFMTAGGSVVNGIAKWNGSSWSALGSGMGGTDHYVSALAVSGSDLYAGGYFTTAGGSAANSIAKWNGSSWSALGSGMNGGVSALAVSGRDLYAGGTFTTAGGKVSPYIARAYLLPLPTLSVLRSGPEVMVSWPSADAAGFVLEQASKLTAPANWFSNTASVTDNGTTKSVTLPATNPAQFFRLRRP